MRERIDGMQVADEVAERVAAELSRHRLYRFTLAQKVGAVFLALIAAASFVLNLLRSTGHV